MVVSVVILESMVKMIEEILEIYSVSKAGIIQLTKYLAIELAGLQIRVIQLAPVGSLIIIIIVLMQTIRIECRWEWLG